MYGNDKLQIAVQKRDCKAEQTAGVELSEQKSS